MNQVVMVSLDDLRMMIGSGGPNNAFAANRTSPKIGYLFRFGDGEHKYLALLTECVPIVAKITNRSFEEIKEIPLFGGTSSVKVIDCGVGTELF